jgi:hypothetical protein
MSGNSARRRMMKFMPSEFRLVEARQPPLKDQYDEWLARVICYAFSVPASAFVSQVNRATSETLRMQATQEGLVPLKAWVKGALDHVIQVYLNQPDLEFIWVGDDAVDPLQQAQTLNILVGAGIKTREEARADLGLAPEGGKSGGLGKFNPYHDEHGRFTTAEEAGGASIQYAATNADDKYKYSVNLQEEDEKYGGHTLTKHVGRTRQSLIEAIDATLQEVPIEGGVVSRKIRSESSFVSLESANDLVNRVLQNHTVEVDSVSSGAWDNQWLEDRIGSPTGVEATPGAGLVVYTRPTYNVGVWIEHYSRSPRGYRVTTAYPLSFLQTYCIHKSTK